MDKKENSGEYYTVDIQHIFKTLWHRAWIIVIAGLLAAGMGFAYSAFIIKPLYSSSVMLYVNNAALSIGGSFSISSSEITAAQELVKTYGEILDNRTTYEEVIRQTGVPYNWEQLSKMVKSSASNGTEVMRVTVTGHNPDEAAKIANCIAEVLTVRINKVIDGATMEVVDSAVPRYQKISPSIAKYTAIGLIIGALLASTALAVAAVRDDTIHSEDYVMQNYDYPILAKIPNLLYTSTKQYNYYYQKKNDGEKG